MSSTHVTAGSLVEIFERAGIATQIHRLFEQTPDRSPLEQASGLIFLGGPMSANDTAEHPFLAAEPGIGCAQPWSRRFHC